ncbi:hypothetical protein JCM8547_003940, partial [Rhodosporidiobolus lusitaniae]
MSSAPASPALAAAASPSLAGDSPHLRRTSTTRTRDTFAQMAQQEKALQADPKYRKYSSSVDKCLQSFDQVNEWADFITFLAKLLKCLQAYPQFPAIPHKLIVAKRLSQCLNPALPTGVHQRALDVYTHILTTIGPENLRRDLPAWSSGLFPFFQYAATSVKPIVLNLYERFYLPLQESLRPATKAFILALLPGLEEETGEWFGKVAALLDRLSGTVSPAFFFQNVWLVLITAPTSRIPALNYLARRLPKLESDEGLEHIVGQDVGLMVRGLAAALDDPQILVQRGILDLLTTTLKLDSSGFKSTRRDDQILLFRAVIGVVLRRDLSLSRRLYTWLLGSQDASQLQVDHLRAHGLDLLRAALKLDMDATAAMPAADERERQRPFKIFISLLDKWEIGAQLTDVLVLEAFDALRKSLRPADDHDELLMTGNMLFEILDPFLLWKQIYAAVKAELEAQRPAGAPPAIELARFMIKTFRLHDEEVQKLHAPIVGFALLELVEASLNLASTTASTPPTGESLASALQLAVELLGEVPARFFASSTSNVQEPPPPYFSRSLADTLYGAEDIKSASLPETDGRELLAGGIVAVLRIVQHCAERVGTSGSADEETRTSARNLLLAAVPVLDTLVDVASTSSTDAQPLKLPEWDPASWTSSLLRALSGFSPSVANFPLLSGIVKTILNVSTRDGALQPGLRAETKTVVEPLVAK